MRYDQSIQRLVYNLSRVVHHVDRIKISFWDVRAYTARIMVAKAKAKVIGRYACNPWQKSFICQMTRFGKSGLSYILANDY